MNPLHIDASIRDHVATLEGEAAARRLVLSARAPAPSATGSQDGPRAGSLRSLLGRVLVGLGMAIAASPGTDDPCPDAGMPTSA